MKTIIIVNISICKSSYLYAICLDLKQSLLPKVRIINQWVSGNTLPSGNPLPYLSVPHELKSDFPGLIPTFKVTHAHVHKPHTLFNYILHNHKNYIFTHKTRQTKVKVLY